VDVVVNNQALAEVNSLKNTQVFCKEVVGVLITQQTCVLSIKAMLDKSATWIEEFKDGICEPLVSCSENAYLKVLVGEC